MVVKGFVERIRTKPAGPLLCHSLPDKMTNSIISSDLICPHGDPSPTNAALAGVLLIPALFQQIRLYRHLTRESQEEWRKHPHHARNQRLQRVINESQWRK